MPSPWLEALSLNDERTVEAPIARRLADAADGGTDES